MNTEKITFDKLPEAVQALLFRLDKIEKLLSEHPTSSPEDEILDVKGAHKLTRLAIPTIYSKVNKREIPFIKKGGKLYFSKKELLNYLNEGRVSTAAELKVETIKSLSNG